MSSALSPDQRVHLVQAASVPPAFAHGTIRSVSGEDVEIRLDDGGPAFKVGSSLVLEAPAPARSRAIAVAHRQEGGTLWVRVRKLTPPDQREYPRVEGAIFFSYHVSPQGELGTKAWIIGAPASAVVHTPDPFMNFSATGLSFEDTVTCAEGDTLLFELRVPNVDKTWRGSARVVRVAPIPAEERDPSLTATHRVAIHFTHLAEDAADALRQHTLRIQDAYL